jgi:hypothetical protein
MSETTYEPGPERSAPEPTRAGSSPEPEPQGDGSGEPACALDEAEPSRSDLALVEQAIKGRWPLSAEQRAQIADRLARIAGYSRSPRSVTSAARVLAQLDRINQEEERRTQQIPDYIEHAVTIYLPDNGRDTPILEKP